MKTQMHGTSHFALYLPCVGNTESQAFSWSSGELDPERMGSGIQYGDAALRQLRSPRRTQAPSAQECGC